MKNLVFISYASEDLERVRQLATDLEERGINVWYDKARLRVGPWKPQILKAISHSRFFLICLSESALRKTGDEPGFQDEELNYAYNIAQQQAAIGFSIVPVRLEDCGRGDHRLSIFQQYDLFENWEQAMERLAADLGGFAPKSSTDEQLIKSLYGKAEAYIQADDNGKAWAIWESITIIEGDTRHSLILKARLLNRTARKIEALKVLEELLARDESDVYTWDFKGRVLQNLGRNEEALDAIDRALSLHSANYSGRHHDTWMNRAIILRHLRRDEEGLAACENALSLKPNFYQALLHKASYLYHLGRQNEALQTYDEAFRLIPGDQITALCVYNG